MRSIRDYAIITMAYWAFTVTDGALRMLVLLHLHDLGHTPIEIASLFLFYETFGVVTNLLGGWIGTRFGLKITLTSGLLLQIGALGLLYSFTGGLTLPLVMLAQGASGVAKDLTKMSSKSYIKLLIPDSNQKGLMSWVAILTGSKNTLKGAGFFLGGFLLQSMGFGNSCLMMIGMIVIALLAASILLPAAPGKSRTRVNFRQLISKDARLNWLSLARLFLFGSRDVWFVLALPIFLSASFDWSHRQVGAFLATWVIGYGIIQSLAPAFVGRSESGAPDSNRLLRWTAALVIPLAATLACVHFIGGSTLPFLIGLMVFGVVFAANSAIHSYLVVSYAHEDRIALSIGFYYMANALGRLVGTVLSGVVFQSFGGGAAGLEGCLVVSVAMVVASTIATLPLRSAEARAENPS